MGGRLVAASWHIIERSDGLRSTRIVLINCTVGGVQDFVRMGGGRHNAEGKEGDREEEKTEAP